jgi:hypothetical protein
MRGFVIFGNGFVRDMSMGNPRQAQHSLFVAEGGLRPIPYF